MKRVNKSRVLIYFLFVALLFGVGVYLLKTDKSQIILPGISLPSIITPTQFIASESAELATVQRVIDGDTILLTDGRRVRYIGIDTPELGTSSKVVECFAEEAKKINVELVEGKNIIMKKDVSETDRYKRLLRYVWIPSTSSEQAIFVNEYLIREGYASQSTFPPDVKYTDLFNSVAEESRLKNKGLWNACN